jgi:peptidoglycan/xylan/chitin deacetylase (PgdA/CDA1 family)
MYFLLTNDVELTSLSLNRCDPTVADEVYEVGLPRLLDLYSKYDVESTFYFTGRFAELKPEAVDLVKDYGHEIGCHGYTHEPSEGFDVLPYSTQLNHLKKAKDIIEEIAGRIEAFRAPELRINRHTVKALEEADFKTDSSISPQRFDGPMSFGMKEKMKWMFAPRQPYYLSYESPFDEGDSKVLEVPISAILFPYIGTTMRASPMITRAIQKYLFYEAKKTNKPIVFLFHPNECLDMTTKFETTRQSNNPISYVFGDVIRQRLKMRNLGKYSIRLLDEIINEAKQEGFEFLTVKEYRKNYSSIRQSGEDTD